MKKKFLLFIYSTIFLFSLNSYDFKNRIETYKYDELEDFTVYWIPKTYFDVVKQKDRNHILSVYPKLLNFGYYDIAYDKDVRWYETTFDSYLAIGIDKYESQSLDFSQISFRILEVTDISDDTIKIKGKISEYSRDAIEYSCLNWTFINNHDFYVFYLKFDGDYIYVYENNLGNLFDIFCKMTSDDLNEFNKCMKTNSWSLMSCSFPRHADGTCDYEDVSSVKTVSSPTTNVSPNKTMTVSENLKLRSGEATTSEVITVMSAGTKVKILELGKAENIDGINSNWVKVEVQPGAKDRDGNIISKDTVGWCYGGYLAETTEVNNFESTDTKEISDIKIEEEPKQEINIGIVCAIIGAVLLLLVLILIFGVRKKKDNP